MAIKIDEKAIRKLAEILDETGLTEIEIEEGEMSIRVARGGGTIVTTAAATVPGAPAPANASAPAAAAVPLEKHPGAVTSPMVGTVYLQPEPGTPPFAGVGAKVKAGDTLLIIEAMKVMNPIKAPKAGTVTQVIVNDGSPVEFGEVLMVIE